MGEINTGFLNKSYRFIDESKDLVIEVQKKVSEQGIATYIYSINGVAEDTYNEATGVTVTNCKVETY